MHHDIAKAIRDRAACSWEKAGSETVGREAKAQVKTGRLHLLFIKGEARLDLIVHRQGENISFR